MISTKTFGILATRATILNPLNVRVSWKQRVFDAWYVGPAWDHHRTLTFYVLSTGDTRISANSQLYPEHCNMPRETVMDEVVRVTNNSVKAIQIL